jgi:hypothetical protein
MMRGRRWPQQTGGDSRPFFFLTVTDCGERGWFPDPCRLNPMALTRIAHRATFATLICFDLSAGQA